MIRKFVYKCNVCGFLYDESKEGIPFSDLDKSWLCPVCYVDKSEFNALENFSKVEDKLKESPKDEHVVIIGGGFAGINLAMEMISKSSDIKITLICKEKEWFYSRPLLTRAFYSTDIKKNMYITKLQDMESGRLKILRSTSVTKINPIEKNVIIEDNNKSERVRYDRLVLATGSDAFIPPPLSPFKHNFMVLNNLENYEKILQIKQEQKIKVAIIGGGLIGCELASEFCKMGDEVDLFHMADRLIENVLTVDQSHALEDFFRHQNIYIYTNYCVKEITLNGHDYHIDGIKKNFDMIILAVGFVPRITLAKEAGIVCNRGIVVDGHLQTNIKDIYAVGDVAEINGKTYGYLGPINDQISWLSDYLVGNKDDCFRPKEYPVKIKIHDYEI